MTRRLFLSLPLAAQTRYREYSRCLPDFLRALAADAYARRNREIGKLTTPDAIRARQKWVRETFWRLAGGAPERTPLNPRVAGTFERRGYRVQKVIYESRPRFYVPANLYVPEGQPPFPGVLFQLGHAVNGKASDTYQRCCQGLARLGYVVLAFDPMGQGERAYYGDLPSADDEHTVPGKQMLLYGDTSTRLQVWDAIRSLDYLASLPFVDAKRLASTGQSGGGTLTMLLLAADDRLAAAAVSAGNTENFACAEFNPPGSTDDAEQNFLEAGPAAFDRWDLFYPFAPKPLLIAVSDKDFFGTYSPQYLSSGREEFEKLRRVYEVLGGEVQWASTPLPHGLAYDSRLLIYNFFDRHLKGGKGEIQEEPPVAPEPDRATWVMVTGKMSGETPFTLNRARRVERRFARLEDLLRIERLQSAAAVLGRVPSAGLEIQVLEIPSAPHVWLPAWLFLPPSYEMILLLVEPSGRNVRWRETDLYQSFARNGYAVCAIDVRGAGDLWPEVGRGAPRYTRPHNEEEHYAWASLMLGRPLAGQRTTDILAAAAALRRHLPGKPLRLAAAGRMSVPALFAAALDPALHSTYLAGGLVSFESVVATERYKADFANFVPRLLLHTDLPEIAAAIPRLCLAGAVDASGRRVPLDALRNLYPKAELRPEAKWDESLCA